LLDAAIAEGSAFELAANVTNTGAGASLCRARRTFESRSFGLDRIACATAAAPQDDRNKKRRVALASDAAFS